MKVFYHDDKKEKRQSHEFHVESYGDDSENGFNWNAYSYGKTKEEAIAEIRKAVTLLRDDLQRFLDIDLSEISDTPPMYWN